MPRQAKPDIEAVHRLSKFGAVVTHLARGISEDGFDAEWRDVLVMAVESDTFSRSELFDAGDLDSAIARFEELSRSAPQLENEADLDVAPARFDEPHPQARPL